MLSYLTPTPFPCNPPFKFFLPIPVFLLYSTPSRLPFFRVRTLWFDEEGGRKSMLYPPFSIDLPSSWNEGKRRETHPRQPRIGRKKLSTSISGSIPLPFFSSRSTPRRSIIEPPVHEILIAFLPANIILG